jgi:hypothetical protein
MHGISCRTIPAIIFLLAFFATSTAVSAQENFYAGKTIRLVVGTASGGGYDNAARPMRIGGIVVAVLAIAGLAFWYLVA